MKKALLLALLAHAPLAVAADAKLDPANTAWMITASVLVLFMTLPGLALFYGGLVRAKNVLSVLMQCFSIACVVTLAWVAVGYSLAFGDGGGANAWIGGFGKALLSGVDAKALTSTGIPETVFAMFQLTFAIITPALVIGAYAERVRFSGMLAFSLLWLLVVYVPIAHWVWGGGWLAQIGALDFAGGTVVHIASAAAALACAMVLGKRRGYGTDELRPHNIPWSVLGAGILWFGWFGFNAGSALGSSQLAGSAFLATHLSAAAGLLAWNLAEVFAEGKPTVLGAASGGVAGLVCITPAAGFVEPMPAILIGLSAGFLCYFALRLKTRFGFDDALDVVGVHGVGGTVGALLTGVFATTAVNSAGRDGVLAGNPEQMVPQIIGVVATIAFSFVVSWVILKVLDATMGLRVDADVEDAGLDISEHAETAYVL